MTDKFNWQKFDEAFLKFERGDFKKPNGRCVIYSHWIFPAENILQNNEVEEIFARYYTPNIDDILGDYLSSDFKKAVSDELKKINDLLGGGIVMSSCPIINPKLEDLFELEGDIIHVGEYLHPSLCTQAIILGGSAYKALYEKSIVGWDQITKEARMNYIFQNYISPMFLAKERNDEEGLKKLRGDFIHFSSGSPFVRNVVELCSLFRKTGKPETKDVEEELRKITIENEKT